MVGALVTASVIPSTAFLALLGLGSGATNVGLQAAVGELVPNEVRGRVFGAWGAVQSLIFVMGGLTAGGLSDRIGPAATLLAYSTAFLVTAVYSFFAFRGLPAAKPAPAVTDAGD